LGSDRLLAEPKQDRSQPSRAPRRFGRRGLVEVPDGVSAPLYFVALQGPVLLSAAVGVQLMFIALLAFKPPARDLRLLTDYGAYLFLPERDVMFYLSSIVFTIGLAVGLVWIWNRRVRSMGAKATSRFLFRSMLLQTVVALAGTAGSVYLFLQDRSFLEKGDPVPAGRLAVLGAIAVVSIGAVLLGWMPRGRKSSASMIEVALGKIAGVAQPRLTLSALDLIVPLIICAVIYLPSWRQLAGKFFVEESLFHWDYYSMGPALAFHHGKDLGSEISSMYGIGWPMVFGALFSWTPPSYGRMIQVGSIYGCVYLTGVFVLLRLLVRRPALAALGTGLVSLQLFLGQGDLVIWRFPSLTMMRFPLDVWCFIALILHWRSKRRIWAAAAGAATGMAVVFSTDTGLYLVAACGFYWLCVLWLDGDKRSRAKDIVSFGASSLAVVFIALLLAGRGRIFSSAFVRGWLESILEFGGGFAQLPLATLPNAVTVVSFVVLFFLYLFFLVYGLARLMHNRARHFEVFNGFLAMYGLLFLLHFVGRSGDYTPFRLWIPLALILIDLAGRAYGQAGSYVRSRWGEEARHRVLVRLPYLTAGLAAVVLIAAPRSWIVDPILAYPNLVSSRLLGKQPDGLCLLVQPKDICGLPAEYEGTAIEFRAIAGQLAKIRASGKTFAVIDESGSLFYLAADTVPWGRYPRPFVSLHTKAKLAAFSSSLRRNPPDYVLTRMELDRGSPLYDRWPSTPFGLGPNPDTPFADTWKELSSTIHRLYRLDRTIPPFELWSLSRPTSQLP
jgi:hypothetical protein